jgi:hypothetical protein
MEMVEFAFCTARDWHIQPSEFWAMSPCEFWWEFDAKLKQQNRLEEQAKRSEIRNGFSGGEWADARAELKMKQAEQTNG